MYVPGVESTHSRVPFVQDVQDLWPQVCLDMGQMGPTSSIYRSLKPLERFLYPRADRIVVMAEGTRDYLAARGGKEEIIEFIPNAADPDDFMVPESREHLRARYGFTRLTCVYIGAHGPANDLGLLLDAAEELAEEDVDIVLVGTGPAKADLKARTLGSGLASVRFLDPIPRSEIPQLLAAADIGLHVLADVPLFGYGVSPNEAFDYLAAGLPMVTNVPGEVAALVEESGGGVS